MSFIYYVLILMLSYTGPVYAGLQVEKEVADDFQRYAQTEVEVGELPSGKIKVFTDQTRSTTIVVDKQDCSIMRKKDNSIALGWKFGGLMWGFGPEIKIGYQSGVAWKHDVQRMVAEYQELCTQFNTGRLSQQEYQAEKQQIVQRGYNYARELDKRFKQKKDDMFKEMDQGKYIHLQSTRFYEGCCYYHKRPERNLVAEVQPQKQYNPRYRQPTHQIHSSSADFLRKRMATIRKFDRAFDDVIRSSRINSMNRDRRTNNVRWNINVGGGW